MQWGPYAMVRITAVLVAGSLLCIYHPGLVSFDVAAGLLLALSLLYFFVYRFAPRSYRVRSNLTGIIGLLAILVAGYVGVLVKTASRDPEHLLHIQTPITAYQVKIISAPEEKENSWKRTGDVLSVRTESGWKTATGRINLYWPKQEQVTQLRYGDVLMVKGAPQELQPPYNPHEFDFKRYLRFKNVYHQHFIRSGNWQLVQASNDKGFLYYSQQARIWSLTILKKFISSPREFAIVSALVLGVTDGIDNDLQNAYSASGAMHVLAVSGLHVSIIYGILLFFFRPFTKTKAGHWWVAIISVILLWTYAFITGLSPSVLRAVTMFSFVAIARPAGFTTNIYNTLAASAFCLLLYDPYLIMSVGFQLSYLAVLGIVYIQRPIYLLWSPQSAFVNWVWQISCVSIAAQVATFALGLLYFHQFPVYFLFSNLFVIPGSFVVLVGGILLLLISPLTFVAQWLGIALEFFVKLLNEGVFLVERLPFSLLTDIHITTLQCWLLLGFMLAASLLLQFRKFYWLWMMMICVSLFSIQSFFHFYQDVKPSQFVVYRVQGHRAMEWMEAGTSVFHADSALSIDTERMRFHIRPNRLVSGVHAVRNSDTLVKSFDGWALHHWKGKSFMLLNSPSAKLPDRIYVDYLVIGNNSIKKIDVLSKKIACKLLILDSSNSWYYNQRIEKEAVRLGMTCYNVLAKGAYQLKL